MFPIKIEDIYKYSSNTDQFNKVPLNIHISTGAEGLHMNALMLKIDPNIRASVDRCRIPKDMLTLGNQVGKGNFGQVFKGQLITPAGNMRTVAVKSLKGKTILFPQT